MNQPPEPSEVLYSIPELVIPEKSSVVCRTVSQNLVGVCPTKRPERTSALFRLSQSTSVRTLILS